MSDTKINSTRGSDKIHLHKTNWGFCPRWPGGGLHLPYQAVQDKKQNQQEQEPTMQQGGRGPGFKESQKLIERLNSCQFIPAFTRAANNENMGKIDAKLAAHACMQVWQNAPQSACPPCHTSAATLQLQRACPIDGKGRAGVSLKAQQHIYRFLTQALMLKKGQEHDVERKLKVALKRCGRGSGYSIRFLTLTKMCLPVLPSKTACFEVVMLELSIFKPSGCKIGLKDCRIKGF